MSDRPLEEYSLPYLWKRIEELKATIKLVRECPVFTVHKNPGGRIRVVAKDNIDLALKGEAK